MNRLIFIMMFFCGMISCENASEPSETNADRQVVENTTTVESNQQASETNQVTQRANSDISEVAFINTSGSYSEAESQKYGNSKGDNLAIEDIFAELVGCTETYEKQGQRLPMDCYGKTYNRWDNQLNQYYKLAMSTSPNDDARGALKTAQRSWLKFRDAEFDFMNAYYQSLEDDDEITYMSRVSANIMNIKLVKYRAIDLLRWPNLDVPRIIKHPKYGRINDDYSTHKDRNATYTHCKDVSTAARGMCMEEATAINEKLMNEYYDKLMGKLNREHQTQLKATQTAWYKFKEDESVALQKAEVGYRYYTEAIADMVFKRAITLEQFTLYLGNYQ